MSLLKKQSLSWLLAGITAVAAPAAMAATNLMVLQDTVTAFTVDLLFDADAGLTPYNGDHWNAYFTPKLDNGLWSLEVWYAHKDGPHGEGPEHPGHVLPPYLIMPGSSAQDFGVHDHQGTAVDTVAHADAHRWSIATWADADTSQGGFTAFQVAHVPEPATWLMLIGGLGVVGVGARRRG